MEVSRYSVVGIVGIVVFFKRLKSMYLGTYFWVKFLQSFLNIFSSLLMVTLIQLPFSDMIQSLASFALDQYFCLIIYSYWQAKKIEEGYVSPFDEDLDEEEEIDKEQGRYESSHGGSIIPDGNELSAIVGEINQNSQDVNVEVTENTNNIVALYNNSIVAAADPSDNSSNNGQNQPYLRRDTDATLE
ncbi:UNKNOWN [Stylonychia lemnae]|uniref:Uncharacterized protein n=1 Tax=Stylonychia lemnae TaxID=5949 RepID=A0A078A7C7_STYLE|nr:UNKNOWN [Stylonychia lemnae]|eukprot:CDW76696.1 UNKNOWN [Stylonychia lemnae]